MSSLGLANGYPVLSLSFAAGPSGVFLMRQFMLSIPEKQLARSQAELVGCDIS